MYLSKIHTLSKDTPKSLSSRDGIGWNMKMTIRLSDDVKCVQTNMVNVNEMDYGKWNEWDELKLNEMRWNMNNGVWTEGKEMKHEQWSW